MTALIIGEAEKAKLAQLRKFANDNPIDMLAVTEQVKTTWGVRDHLKRMDRYTLGIPMGFLVTFTIETGHPCGTCRHMSVSVKRSGRVPHPIAMGMLAEELGFVGGMEQCATWDEDIGGGDKAINLVQPIAVTSGPSKAS